MTENGTTKHVPTERQLDLFRALEDLHDLTKAITILLVDEDGALLAASGDENDVPPALRTVLSGKQLAAAGGVRALLEPVENLGTTNVTILDVDGKHVLAILFDAEADVMTVQTVGREASALLREILAA